ncbi:MAG: DoxX family membrane protein [Saprospiraceae bacterium]|nr:DoxX family membrane protein [Saprospiraceae bacterium]
MKTSKILKIFYGGFELENKYSNIALLLLRIYAGITMMSVGLDKTPLPEWMTEQVVSIGFPFPVMFAWLACFSEFAFGAMLALGLFTRISSVFIGITMAVASFGFQKVLPFVDMHIAQHYVWTTLLFMVFGGGKYALDTYVRNKVSKGIKGYLLTGFLVLAGLFAYSMYAEFTSQEQLETEESFVIDSVNVAGTFNDWDPGSNSMLPIGDSIYQFDLQADKNQLINFKFTANGSWDYNLGEIDQEETGFPVIGKAIPDENNNTSNIQAYLPDSGMYRIILNLNNFEYSVDEAN